MLAAWIFHNGNYYDFVSDVVMSTALIGASIIFLLLFSIHIYAKLRVLYYDPEVRDAARSVLRKVTRRISKGEEPEPASPTSRTATDVSADLTAGEVELVPNPLLKE